jgi:hypothetical protein
MSNSVELRLGNVLTSQSPHNAQQGRTGRTVIQGRGNFLVGNATEPGRQVLVNDRDGLAPLESRSNGGSGKWPSI